MAVMSRNDTVETKRLIIRNGDSVIVEIGAAKDAGVQFNIMRKNAEGTLVNVLAVDVAKMGEPIVRAVNPATGGIARLNLGILF